jgi:putative ABC transport system permease protein
MTEFLEAISLVAGGIGVMNIMLVSVTERTREVGLSSPAADRVWHCGFGVSIRRDHDPCVDRIDRAGVLFLTAMRVFFGIYPANRAASPRLLNTLRYE